VSGKTEKAIRKLAKQELEKRMQSNGQPPQRQVNILDELVKFITTSEILTGAKPDSITLTDAVYNAYVQTAQNNAEDLGLNPGFKTGEPTFLGVKLIKKSPLIVPAAPSIVTPPTEPTN